MKRFYLLLLFCVSLVASGAINPPENLKTDYNKMPLGIDNPAPGFSWEVGDESRGAIQSAYRILVSSSPDLLNQEEGDIWDSGKIDSGNTIQIKYEGKPLKSSTRYYWAVKTWNAEDEATEFSKPS